jgi:hypothetical protein
MEVLGISALVHLPERQDGGSAGAGRGTGAPANGHKLWLCVYLG